MTEVPEAAIEAGRFAIEAVMLRSGGSVVLPFASEGDLARAVLEAALPHLLPPPAPDLTAVRWRPGGSHLSNVWAETGETGGKPGLPAGRMDTDVLAARACADHNAMLDLQWLLAAGLDVRVAPCGGAGRCCGDTPGRFSVRAAKPDPAADLSVPGGVESHGHASPGEALAFAREWCERNGVTP